MSNSKYTETGYMCLTDARYEVGLALGGNIVYASIQDLKKNRECVEACGIAQVSITIDKVIKEAN